MRRLPWLEDFNTRRPHADPPAEAPSLPPQDEPDPRLDAWTEGFLAGCRAARADAARLNQDIAADLARRVAAIEHDLVAMVDQSAATVGGLLIDILAAALPSDWPAARLGPIVEAIRPVFDLEPRLHICPRQPGEASFRTLPALYKALDAGDWDLAARWHQAASDSDPSDLAARIRQAIAPAAGETNTAATVAQPHHAGADKPAPAEPDRPKVSSAAD
jgi:hypothetical protein